MNFDELTNFLEKRLQLSMPGAPAHDLMKPKLANGAPIRMKHATPAKEGGVLILIYENNGIAHFPLIQRPNYEGIHSGQIALPGGKMEESDVDLTYTALRETREEIGVEENEIEVIGSLSKFFVSASNYNVLPVIGKTHSIPSFIPDPHEVAGIITPPVHHLVDPTKRLEKEMVVRNGVKLVSPYFNLEQQTVWGATAMMLSELVVILEEFQSR